MLRTISTTFFGVLAMFAMSSQEALANPDNGDGAADWTVVHGGGTLVVHMEINAGVAEAISLSGVEPAVSALPIKVTNSDGETLKIVASGSSRIYSGFYEIEIDDSNSNCTHCVCSILDPICLFSGGSYQDCWVNGNTCSQWGCGGGGGGIVKLNLDFTTDPTP